MYTANTKKRIIAHVLDQFMTYLFYLPLLIKVGIHYFKSGHEVIVPWTWLFSITILHMIFQTISLYVLRALPAQWLMGLQVVSTYHPEMGLSLSQCFIHALVDKLKFFVGNSVYYVGLINRERRHLINILAETRVVQKEPSDGILQPKLAIGVVVIAFSLVGSIWENAQLIRESNFDKVGWSIHYSP
jgi:uncharacterized RDD family membrane protein YckC